MIGRHDVIAPVQFSQEIARGISHAQLEIFEYSGHNPPDQETVKFRRIVTSFLKAEIL